jgi:hypothetical protein
MAVQFPVDKLTLINSALALTGDNLVNVADDGSDEWNVCSPAYERALGVMIEDHGWGFATTVVPNLAPASNAPANVQWDTAYNLPEDLIHLIWVKINLDTLEPTAFGLASSCLYDIEGGQLVLNAQGGPPPPIPPQAPAQVSIKYISSTNADPVNATPLFVLALQCFVQSGIYRGLHEDTTEADKLWQAGEMYSQRARSRYDMQKPKRSMWNSRITAARRVRRPWPPSPGGWGGSGIPG